MTPTPPPYPGPPTAQLAAAKHRRTLLVIIGVVAALAMIFLAGSLINSLKTRRSQEAVAK